jgi:hypothetical protein
MLIFANCAVEDGNSVVFVSIRGFVVVDGISGFGVSGGENGLICCRSGRGVGGDLGVLGKGFSTSTLLTFFSCLLFRELKNLSVLGGAEATGGLFRLPLLVSMFVGLFRFPETDPNFAIPLRTPVKKSPPLCPEEDSSSVVEADEELSKVLPIDSIEPWSRPC